MSIALIFNQAPLYRENIYTRIDGLWNCFWFFGESSGGIKTLNLTKLKNKEILPTAQKAHFWYFKKNIISLLKSKEVSEVIAIGDPRCLSIWRLLITNKFRQSKYKVFLWTHGWYGNENFIEKLLKKFFFSLADGIFLYGNYAKELMLKEGISGNSLYVIKNSLDYETQLSIRSILTPTALIKRHFNNENKNLIFIGRLTKSKRLDLLLEALSFLKEKENLFNLIIVGDGPEMNYLKEEAKKLNVDQQIWFYGSCYDEKVNAELIYNADLCVSPGNIGLTAIHVLMFGTPCITHNHYSFQGPEFEAIKDGTTGAFFKQNSSLDLANTIEQWFNNHTDREVLRQQCYNEIDNHWNPGFQIGIITSALEER